MVQVLKPKTYKIVGLFFGAVVFFILAPYYMLATKYIELFSLLGVVLVFAIVFGAVGAFAVSYKILKREPTLILGPKGIYITVSFKKSWKKWIAWKDIKSLKHVRMDFKWPLGLGPKEYFLAISVKNPKKYGFNKTIFNKSSTENFIRNATLDKKFKMGDVNISSSLLPYTTEKTIEVIEKARKKYSRKKRE